MREEASAVPVHVSPEGLVVGVSDAAELKLDPSLDPNLHDTPTYLASRTAYLPAGEPDLIHTEAHEYPCQPHNLLRAQQALVGLQLHAISRHAVGATEIASLRDGDAEVVVEAAEGVRERGHAWCD